MTALGGVLSLQGSPPDKRCASILRGQARYGQSPAVCAGNSRVTLGRSLYPTLPEDQFDRGPVHTGGLILVGDVRIDNRAEVAALVGISEQAARTSSDAMLAAALIERRGANGLATIVGEFALAWWDEAEQSLKLARDVLARRPLIYHRNSNFVAFASMPSGLHALQEIPAAIDPDWLAADVAHLPHRGRATPHHAIERVLPGHVVTFGRHRFSEEQFGHLEVALDYRLKGEQAEEALRAAVEQAVRAQLRGASDKVASHLSAGLDSAIVTTTAARLLPGGRVSAFTAAPRRQHGADSLAPARISDESVLASEVAATQSNIDHEILRSDLSSPLAAMAKDFFFNQQPTQNPANAPWGRLILREVHAKKIKVLLTGGGGNLTATYAAVEELPEMLAKGSLLKVARGLQSLRRSGRSWPSSLAAVTFPLLPGAAWRTAGRLWRGPLGLAEYAAVAPMHMARIEDRAAALEWRTDYPPRRDPFRTRIEGLTCTDGAYYYKGVLAEWGVSVRDPLLDLQVIRLCLAIPPHEYLRGKQTRQLARRAFADRLPGALLTSRKRGLQAADWAYAATAAAADLREEVETARRTPGLGDIVDLDLLEQDIAALSELDPATVSDDFRFKVRLLRGISATYFARRTAGTN